MIRRQKNRKPLDYVKPYYNIEAARNDLQGMKRAYRYYRDKRDTLKAELLELGLWNNMPEDYRFEMYALRTMMGILEAKITKATGIYKKLQKEESARQTDEKLKNIKKLEKQRDKEYDEHFTSPYQEVDKDGIKYNVTKEHYELIQEAIKQDCPYCRIPKDRQKIMQKIREASKEIAKKSSYRTRVFREVLLEEVKKNNEKSGD